MSKMPFRLEGRRALVTGGSKGIDLAAAELLRELGAEVTIAARTEGPLQAAAERTGAAWVAADVSTAEGVAEVLERAGEVDILVANAGARRLRCPAK